MIAEIVNLAFTVMFFAVLAWVILSWVQTGPDHPLRRLQERLDRIILPLIRPIQRVVPPIRLGAGALDLSPIILILIIRLAHGPIVSLASRLF